MYHNPIWFNIRSLPKIFVGRENETQEIDEECNKCEETRGTLFVAITGIAGVGKSDLAVNYAKRFHEKEQGHCICIDAETKQTVFQSFQDLAEKHLGVPLKNESGKEKCLKILVSEIYELISREKCLIIFDNCESYENPVFKLLTDLSENGEMPKPFVIITSRLRNSNKFFGNKCHELELDVLLSDPSFGFFSQSFNLNEDLANDNALVLKVLVQKLCERLQYHPLAMQQAAACIKQSLGNKHSDLGKEISNYFDEIDKETRKIMDQNLPQYESLEPNSKTNFITWKIALNKISKLSEVGKSAVQMINIISLLSAENISTEFLTKLFVKMKLSSPFKLVSCGSKKTKLSSKDLRSSQISLQVLGDYALINLIGDQLSVPRLVQEVTRIGNSLRTKSNSYLVRILSSMQEMLDVGELPLDQVIHAKIIWEHTTKVNELIKKHLEFPKAIYKKLSESGKYRDAFEFCSAVINVLQVKLGEDSQWVLEMKSRKGRALDKLGEYDKSLELLTQVYEKQKKLFGEDSEYCFKTANLIGDVYWTLDDYHQANKWYENTQKRQRRNTLSGKI